MAENTTEETGTTWVLWEAAPDTPADDHYRAADFREKVYADQAVSMFNRNPVIPGHYYYTRPEAK